MRSNPNSTKEDPVSNDDEMTLVPHRRAMPESSTDNDRRNENPSRYGSRTGITNP